MTDNSNTEKRTITIEWDSNALADLDRLVAASNVADTLDDLVNTLLDHVHQGLYRSGSWERGWLEQCVGHEAIEKAYKPADDPINLHRQPPTAE